MLHKHSILGCAAVAFLASSSWAGVIQDPAAGVEADNFSEAISTFGRSFSPTANGGVLGLYNDTGARIVALFLNTIIATNLTPADISSSFVCNSGAANPFFLNCGFDYDSFTGTLMVKFFGVNPPSGDPLDPGIGAQSGIPPVPASCLSNPDSEFCAVLGHFAFVFNNGFQTSGDVVNGWVPETKSTANPDTFLFTGPPIFDAPAFAVDVPEPSSFLLLGGAILALAGLSRRRTRGQTSKRTR